MIIVVENTALPDAKDAKILQETAMQALAFSKRKDVDLSIVLEDDEVLRQLNHQYRGLDETTDVLSFQANEIEPSTGVLYLGDILISLSQAARQCEKSGHSLLAELQLLVVHGVLHLLGHDHAELNEKQAMFSAQKEILNSLGVKLAVWPGE